MIFLLKRYAHFIVFFVTALIPLLWSNNYFYAEHLGFGDYLSPIDLSSHIKSILFTYQPKIEGGLDHTFNQAYLSYYIFLSFVLIFIKSSSIQLIISTGLFIIIAEIGFYNFIRRILPKKINFITYVILISSSISYALSPYFISNIIPGHLSSLFILSFFPFYLSYLLDFIENSHLKIIGIIKFILLVFFSAPGFANVGNFLSVLIILFVFVLIYCSIKINSAPTIFAKFIAFVFSIFSLNLWWFLPFALGLKNAISMNTAGNWAANAINYATKYSYLINTFSGVTETYFHVNNIQYFSSLLYKILMALMLAFSIKSLISMNLKARPSTHILPLFSILLFAVFIAKGSNAPFGDFFTWLLNNVTIFSIFRRPGSKIYWAFLFGFFSIFILSLWSASSLNKPSLLKKVEIFIISFAAIAISSISIITVIVNPAFIGVTPSKDMISIKHILESNSTNSENTRLLIFPRTWGSPHTLTPKFSNYYGINYLGAYLDQTILIPEYFNNASGGGAKTLFRNMINELGNEFTSAETSNPKKLCSLLKSSGINYIVFDKSVAMNSFQLTEFSHTLDYVLSSTIATLIYSGNEIHLFEVNNQCTSNLLFSNRLNGASDMLKFTRRNPGEFSISLPALTNEINLTLLENYSNEWVISTNTNRFEIYLDNFLNFKNSDTEITHIKHDDWANQWNIQTKIPFDNLVLIYKSQLYFYLGALISIFYAFTLLLIGHRLNRRVPNTRDKLYV